MTRPHRPRTGEWIALALYVVLGVFLLVHHEAWCDEADTWLVARDAPLSVWPSLLGREGMPPLWDLTLLPFARAGAPYVAQAVIHLVIASLSAALVLFLAPFRFSMKLMLIFSYYMGYEYLAVARQYALMIFLLFLLAVFYRNRDHRPIAFAIFFAFFVNTAAHALLIGATIGPVLAWHYIARRTPRRWPALAIMLTGGIIAGLPLLIERRNAMVIPFSEASASMRRPLYSVARAFVPMIGIPTEGSRLWRIIWIAVVTLAIAIFIAASLALMRDRSTLLILWLSWSAVLFISVSAYWGGLHHSGLLLIALIFALWIRERPGSPSATNTLYVLLYAALALSLLFAVRVWRLDALYPYSGSKDMAQYLLTHHLEQRPIAARGQSVSVLAYLPKRAFWYPHENRYGSYTNWSRSLWKMAAIPVNVAAERALQKFSDVPDLLIMTNEPVTLGPKARLRLLHTTPGAVFGNGLERYWLYERMQAAR